LELLHFLWEFGLFGGNKTMIPYNGYVDDDDATKEAGADFARRGDRAPRNSDDDADVADFFERRD